MSRITEFIRKIILLFLGMMKTASAAPAAISNEWGIIASVLLMIGTYVLSIELPQYPWLIAMVAASLIVVSNYLKKLGTEPFDVPKALGSLLVGALIGLILHNSGIPVTEQELYIQIPIYYALTSLVENGIRAIIRWAFQRQPPAQARRA